MVFDLDVIKNFYSKLPELIDLAKNKLSRPLTLTEKILLSHLNNESLQLKYIFIGYFISTNYRFKIFILCETNYPNLH